MSGVALSQLGAPRRWVVFLAGAAVILHGALAFRRTHPAVSFGVVAAVMAGIALVPDGRSEQWTPLFMPSSAVFLFSLYAYAAYGDRAAPRAGLAVGIVGSLVVAIRVGVSGASGNAPTSLRFTFLSGAVLAAMLAAWSLGIFRRVRFAYVGALEDRAVRAEADREQRARTAVRDERARIAAELHDIVAHSLSIVVSQADGGRYAAQADPARGIAALGTISDTARSALADMRALLELLGNEQPGETSRLPQPTLADLPDLLSRVRAAGLPIRYSAAGSPRRIGPVAELAVFRLVQESLTNILKHARPASPAEVAVHWTNDEVRVRVSNDGAGYAAVASPGRGLIGMQQRFAVAGGAVHAGPHGRDEFMVTAAIPYSETPGREIPT